MPLNLIMIVFCYSVIWILFEWGALQTSWNSALVEQVIAFSRKTNTLYYRRCYSCVFRRLMTVLKTWEYLLVRNLSSALWIRIFSVNCNVCFSSLGCLLTYILPYVELNTPRYLEFCNIYWCQQAEIHPIKVCSFLLLFFFSNGQSGYCNALENMKLHTAIFFKFTSTHKGTTAWHMFDWLDNSSKLYHIHRLCNVDCVSRDLKSISPNKNEEPY